MKKMILMLSCMIASSWAEAEAPRKLVVYNLTETSYSFDAFTEKTGIDVDVIPDDDDETLEKKLLDPSNPEKPDLVIQQDILNFAELQKAGVLAPISSSSIEKSIPANLRDLKSGWSALSYHARTIAYNPKLVSANEISTYEDLANPKWKGKLCLRKATYTYTRALISSLILALGAKNAEDVIGGWVSNNSNPIFAGDLYALQALEKGDCAVAFTNSDFFARYQAKFSNSPLKLFWANQNGRGVHVNVTGLGLLKSSTQKNSAVQLIELISSDSGSMQDFADSKLEYPANSDVPVTSGIDKTYGKFKIDFRLPSEIADHDEEAQQMALRAHYNP